MAPRTVFQHPHVATVPLDFKEPPMTTECACCRTVQPCEDDGEAYICVDRAACQSRQQTRLITSINGAGLVEADDDDLFAPRLRQAELLTTHRITCRVCNLSALVLATNAAKLCDHCRANLAATRGHVAASLHGAEQAHDRAQAALHVALACLDATGAERWQKMQAARRTADAGKFAKAWANAKAEGGAFADALDVWERNETAQQLHTARLRWAERAFDELDAIEPQATYHTVYTVGYQAWALDDLKATCERLGALLVDIRYSATSSRAEWQQRALQDALGARYAHLPQFGNRNYKSGPIELADAETGLEWLAPLLATQPVILLCACRDAARCHRHVVAELVKARLGASYEHLDAPVKVKAVQTGSESRAGEYEVPSGAREGACRSCQAPVVWITTERGAQMPLSMATVVEREGKRFALSHFSDCEQGKGWSKKGGAK